MNPVLYSSDATSFETNGFGRMSDAISCKVTEERNGAYELVMVYPVNGIHFSDLSERMILYAIHDDLKEKEPFRIYEITKPLNGQVTVRARHVSYDLNKIVVSPFTATSCHEALIGLKNHSSSLAVYGPNVSRFSIIPVNKDNVIADFTVEVPTAFRALLGGSEGSILDVYGPIEYKWEGWNLKVYLNRGQDTDVYIRYGKNLTELEDTVNVENTFSAVYPFWKGQEEVTNAEGTEYKSKIVYISDAENQRILVATAEDENGNQVSLPLEVVPLDLSSEFENPPTQSELRQKAESYLRRNTPWVENRNISVSFVALWQTEEYKHIAAQRLSLCDSVRVVHKKLGVKIKKKIVKVEYDVLNERYISMELGDSSKSFTSALKNEISTGLGGVKSQLSSIIQLITPHTEIQNAIDAATTHATELIRGGLGGHIEIVTNANGEPEEILIMEKPDKDDPDNKRMWRWNLGGLGYSSTGYNGTFTPAITSDGSIVADFITTGALTANIITAGVLSAGNGNTTLNMDTGRLVAKNFKIDTSSVEGSSFEIDSSKFKVAPNGDVSIINGLFENANVEYNLSVKRNSNAAYNNYATFIGNRGLFFSKYNYDKGTIDRILFNISSGHSGYMSLYGYEYPETIIDISDGNEGGLAFNSDASGIYPPAFFINAGKNPNGHTEDLLFYGDIGIIYSELVDPMPPGAIDPTVNKYFDDYKITIEPSYYSTSKEPLLIIKGHVAVDGDISCLNGALIARGGQKYRAVDTKHYGTVGLAAMESPEPVFADFGSNTLDSDGRCYVEFESIFAETIDLSRNYQVFYTQTSPGKIDYVEKRPDRFIVHGDPGTEFDWIVYAKQIDYSDCRFTRLDNKGKGDIK